MLRRSLWSAARHHQYLSEHLGNCCSNLTLARCMARGPFDSVILWASLSIFRTLQLDQKHRQLLCSQQTNPDWHISSAFTFLHLLHEPFIYKTLLSIFIDYAGGGKPFLSSPRHLLSLEVCVCVYVCRISQQRQNNLVKFCAKLDLRPRKNWLDFGSDIVTRKGHL